MRPFTGQYSTPQKRRAAMIETIRVRASGKRARTVRVGIVNRGWATIAPDRRRVGGIHILTAPGEAEAEGEGIAA